MSYGLGWESEAGDDRYRPNRCQMRRLGPTYIFFFFISLIYLLILYLDSIYISKTPLAGGLGWAAMTKMAQTMNAGPLQGLRLETHLCFESLVCLFNSLFLVQVEKS